MAMPWEADFYKSKEGADIWDGLSLGHSTERMKRGYRNVGEGLGDMWNDVTGKTAARAAERAAGKQLDASERANAQLKEIYEQNRTDMMSWLESGKANLGILNQMMQAGQFNPDTFSFTGQDLENNPGYQFRINQATKGLDRRGAALGNLRSGGNDVELMQMLQGMAGDEYQNAFGREYTTFGANRAGKMDLFNMLSMLSGQGQTQSQAVGNLGSNFGANSGNLITGGANAQAAGMVGAANARTAGTQNILNMLLQGGALAFG